MYNLANDRDRDRDSIGVRSIRYTYIRDSLSIIRYSRTAGTLPNVPRGVVLVGPSFRRFGTLKIFGMI